MSGGDDVLRVPLVHLRHAAAQDLLAAAREGVGAGDGAAVDAPHVDVGAGARHDVPLRHRRRDDAQRAFAHQPRVQRRVSFATHRQLVDAQRRDGRPVAPQLRDEGELVEVPDDAGSIPRAADHDAVR